MWVRSRRETQKLRTCAVPVRSGAAAGVRSNTLTLPCRDTCVYGPESGQQHTLGAPGARWASVRRGERPAGAGARRVSVSGEKRPRVLGRSGARPRRVSRHVRSGGGGGPGRFGFPASAAADSFASAADSTASAAASSSRPCNIYAAGGTPCVAAYSTVRALYRTYRGPLYRITRGSDGTAASIGTLPGGYADAAAQDSFCAGTVCTITRLYDQSGHGNDLGVGPVGGNGGPDAAAIANALPVKVGGHPVYGVNVQAGVGYRRRTSRMVSRPAGQPQGAYMVTSGTHVDSVCCFDFGNAETSGTDTGNGHMDAINFGTECWFSPCTGSGPWVQADLENGLFAGGNGSDPANKGNSAAFVTAIMNNNGTTTYAIKDANAQSGGVTTEYSGPLPDIGGYTPMHQEGAVILGTGGDNSNGSDGSFFEGVMTAGYPSAATDNAVQAKSSRPATSRSAAASR